MVEKALWDHVGLVFAVFPQEDQLRIRYSVDDEADDENDESYDEPRVVVITSTVVHRSHKLGIHVMKVGVEEQYLGGHPDGDFIFAVSCSQRGDNAPRQEMNEKEEVEGDVEWGIKVKAGEVADGEDENAGNEIHGDVGRS